MGVFRLLNFFGATYIFLSYVEENTYS